MRTAIFLAGLMVADAIKNGEMGWDKATSTLMGIFFLSFIVMDIIDFFRSKK